MALPALAATGVVWAAMPEPVSPDRIRALEPAIARLATSSGTGTGFIVRADGVMVTAYHVVAGEAAVWAHFPGGRVCRAEGLLAVFPEHDLALLKLHEKDLPSPLPAIQLHPQSGPIPEAAVAAAGYPGGEGFKVAHGRLVPRSEPLVKGSTDRLNLYARVGPGFSGGPALDTGGRAVGVIVSGIVGEKLSFAAGLGPLAALPAPGSPVESFDACNQRLAESPEHQYSRGIRVLDFWRDHEEDAPQVRSATEWALLQFNEVRRKRPALEGAHLNAAYCYARLGKHVEAVQTLEGGLKNGEDPLAARLALAEAYLGAKQLVEAERAIRQVLRFHPTFPPARRCLATCYVVRKRLDLAEAELRAAVRDEPGDARSHLELGKLLAAAGKRDASAAEIQKAGALDPEDAELQQAVGKAYLAIKRHRQAAEALRTAVRIRPHYARAHYGLALACLGLGDHDGARRAYEELEELKSGLAPKLAKLLAK